MTETFLTSDLAVALLNLSLALDITEEIEANGQSNLLFDLAYNKVSFYDEKNLDTVYDLKKRYGLTMVYDTNNKLIEVIKLMDNKEDIANFVEMLKSIEFDEDNDYNFREGLNFIYGSLMDIPFTLCVINNFGHYTYELTWVEENPNNLYFEDLIIMQFVQLEIERVKNY